MHDEYKYTINNKEHIFEKMVFIKKILQYVIVANTILKSHNFNVLQTLVCILYKQKPIVLYCILLTHSESKKYTAYKYS